MVGYVQMREAAIWLQTEKPSRVQIAYRPEGTTGDWQETTAIPALAETGNTARIILPGLKPGTSYDYRVIIDGQRLSFDYATRFTTPPYYRERTPPPDFTVALGSGNYVNDPEYDPLNRIPGGDHSVFLAILAKHPDFMIWLGNNIHLREPDWTSLSGAMARYAHNRSLPELQPLLAGTSHVATWSTHDFGPGNGDRFSPSSAHARKAFDLHWANPPLEVPGLDGITSTFRWADAEFFILDDRTHRDLTSRIPAHRKALGDAQLDWLVESLRRSDATFKIVAMGAAVLNPDSSPGNYRLAEGERERLLERLRSAGISGLFFISGGKPHGELTKMVRSNAPDVHELTLGPLTARPASEVREINFFRVPGTTTLQRHFAMLQVHGPENERQLRVTVYDVNGTELWSDNFHASHMAHR